MDINIEYKDVNASDRLEKMAIDKLNSMVERFGFMVSADVYFKKENTSDKETGMVCEMRINIPGDTLFAETSSANFETAISETSNDIKRQLQKKKEKMQTY